MSEIKLPAGLPITGKLGEVISINHAPSILRKGDELFTADQMKAAILEERERCAKICDFEFWRATQRDGSAAGVAAGNCAEAIRSQ